MIEFIRLSDYFAYISCENIEYDVNVFGLMAC